MTPQSVTYSADGICTTFGFDFAVFEPADLEVLLNGTIQTSGFTLLGASSPEGGAVRFASAPSAGTSVTLRRTGKVQVSGSDAPGFLEAKVVAGDHITVTKTSDAAGEHLAIATDINPADFATAEQGAKADSALQPSAIGTTVQAHDAKLDWVSANLTDAGKVLIDDADAAAQRATLGLATVAASGSYNDLSDKPSLGSAAALNVDTDGALAANSDSLIASEKAVKTYVDGKIAAIAADIAIDERNILRQALSSAVHGGIEAEALFGGFCDAFNADTIGANSSGHLYNSSSHLYANQGTELYPSVTPISVPSINSNATFALMDGGAMAIPAGSLVRAIGIYDGAAMSGMKPKLFRRNSAGNFNVVAEVGSVNHGGTGWEFFDLPTPYTIPSDGYSYYAGFYFPSSLAYGLPSHTANPFDAYVNADASGNNVALTEESGALNSRTVAVAVRYDAVNMTLVSNALSPAPASALSTVKLLVLWKDESGSASLNTDFTAEATRDGSTWTAGTLMDSGFTLSGFNVLWADVDVSGQPSGTTVKYRLKTFNAKSQQVKGVALLVK